MIPKSKAPTTKSTAGKQTLHTPRLARSINSNSTNNNSNYGNSGTNNISKLNHHRKALEDLVNVINNAVIAANERKEKHSGFSLMAILKKCTSPAYEAYCGTTDGPRLIRPVRNNRKIKASGKENKENENVSYKKNRSVL